MLLWYHEKHTMQGFEFIFVIAVLIVSVIVHEISHGYAAERLGDPTARLAGRLTMNPLPHLDILGSLIFPTLSYFLGGFIVGWAKPVPYNPDNMRNPRWGGAIVAAAGPLVNVAIALIFGLLIRFASALGLPDAFIFISSFVVFINIVLAFLNLMPIPPLDGSKILFAILPYRFYRVQEILEQYGLVVLLFIIFFLWKFLLPAPYFVFKMITGIGFF